jgi:putative protease
MRYAFAFGADAVYAGQPRYSLRVRNNDFLAENLAKGINEAHGQGKKFFLAANVIPHNAKVKTFMADIAPIIAMQPDALIMADPGLIMMTREAWPDMTIHVSVQANTVNYASVKFWQSIGVKRVILSRELSLDEIAEIRQLCPDMELEVFVHGALCIAYSGRCLLSGYFNHRDPNQGTCTNSCRWKYDTLPAYENAEGDLFPDGEVLSMDDISTASCGGAQRHPLADKTYFLEEEGRKGELLPIMEDEKGATSIL